MSFGVRLRLAASVLFVASVASTAAFAQDVSVLYSFSGRTGFPHAELLHASNGKLYGTTTNGGIAGIGSVYVLEPDATGGYTYTELYAATVDSEGSFFINPLVEGPDGWLYGTTLVGGDNGFGIVFRVSTAGAYEKLASFDSTTGMFPNGLILASDGAFYGTTYYGLLGNSGSAFRFTPGGGITVIHAFGDSNEFSPSGRLYQAANGDFYGVTTFSATGPGTVFRMTTAGATTVLHVFSNSDGAHPVAGVTAGADGNLYGTTEQGGPDPGNPLGVIYKIDSQDVVTTVHAFTMADGLVAPQAALLLASDGKLYGTAGSIFRLETDGGVTLVHALTQLEGTTLVAPLIEPTTGHLFGTAELGGAGGYGTVFDCDFAGNLEVVYAFEGSAEGLAPSAGVVQGADGSFYGTTQEGGVAGQGVIFRLDSSNSLTVLHALLNGEGLWPRANLTFGPDGRLYGTTFGSDGFAGPSAFAIDTLGSFDLLHSFSWNEARQLYAGLLWSSASQLWGAGFGTGPFRLDPGGTVTLVPVDDPTSTGTLIESDGSLYGTSTGSVYKITGSTSQTLHTFPEPNGYYNFLAGLLKAADGNFYGTTEWGGAYNGGTVFRMDPSGTVTTIHDFQFPDGTNPGAALIQASDGFLYGTTAGGAVGYFGTVYRIDYSGTGFSMVHAFSGLDGREPAGSVIQASDGSLVGTTFLGGALNGGTIFRLTLPPVVLAVSGITPSSGPSSGGAAVAVAGAGFVTGATSSIGGAALANPSVAGPTQLLGATPVLSPGTLNDVVVTNPDQTSATLVVGFLADFLDVPVSDIFHGAVESIFRHGITAGCGGGLFCRQDSVTRAQMAVFLVKAIEGPSYQPPPATGTVFGDVPADAFAAAWIEDFASRGITNGCGGGNYCPDAPVTRAQMAVFLLKALLGASYQPPAATGTVFGDVPAGAFAAAWIEDLFHRAITGGCSASPELYCPDSPSTRGQMAVFLVRTFSLP
jgi:uncharacterized repeat protein (TIGR03803 family)